MTAILAGRQEYVPNPKPDGAAIWYSPDLEEARRVQQRLFPRNLPALPGWDLVAACRPARMVAGDYYDVFPLGRDQVVLTLGDVAGKGLGPALVMAGLRAVLHSLMPHRSDDLLGVMGELNDYLLDTTPDEMFVSLFLSILDVPTGRLRYANAGHIPPLVLAAGEPMPFTMGGPLLGIIPGADFEEGEVTLNQGSLLALYSDGVTEAMNEAGRMFHQRRVVASLRAGRSMPVIKSLEHLLKAVEQFRGKSEPPDDISIILLRRWDE
jgi:phosphoserine phosphatase RsbU/P